MSRKQTAHKMSQTYHVAQISDRIGFWARMAWPNSRAKNLANLLGISESQAKRILGGESPTSRQIAIMSEHWGWRFVHFIFEGMLGPIPPAREISAQIEELDRRIRRVEQGQGNAP